MQCCYRRRLAPELQESQPHTCVLLQLSSSGLTPAARQLLQAALPTKAPPPPEGHHLSIISDCPEKCLCRVIYLLGVRHIAPKLRQRLKNVSLSS